jgi:hypothetical protein
MSRISIPLVAALVLAGAASQTHAELFQYFAFLDGPSESPPVPSPGTGFATVEYDDEAHTLDLHVEFQDLVGTTTVSHIHGPTVVPLAGNAPVMTTTPSFAGFPVGVTAGTYDAVLDLTLASSYNPSFVTLNGGSIPASEIALTNALAEGRAYWNIHSTFSPPGEIRGFLIPEPASLALLAVGALFLRRRR